MMKDFIIGFIAIVIVICVSVGVWMIKREFNYSFDYENKVIETIEKKYEQRITALEIRVKALEKQ